FRRVLFRSEGAQGHLALPGTAVLASPHVDVGLAEQVAEPVQQYAGALGDPFQCGPLGQYATGERQGIAGIGLVEAEESEYLGQVGSGQAVAHIIDGQGAAHRGSSFADGCAVGYSPANESMN